MRLGQVAWLRTKSIIEGMRFIAKVRRKRPKGNSVRFPYHSHRHIRLARGETQINNREEARQKAHIADT